MTYEMAVKILDRVREGIYYPERIVTQALILTGDLDADGPDAARVGSATLAQGVQEDYRASWSQKSQTLVDRDDSRY